MLFWLGFFSVGFFKAAGIAGGKLLIQPTSLSACERTKRALMFIIIEWGLTLPLALVDDRQI